MARVVGGMPVGRDGRVHTTLTHNPSSLRLSSIRPNLQNIPRGNDPRQEAERWVKEIFVTPQGYVFWERDFSGIEAVLVGYFAGSPTYIRAAKLGVHAFLCSHIVGQPASWAWSDADLSAYFKEIKGKFKVEYDTAKRIVHGSNYMMTPSKMQHEYPETFKTIAAASRLQGTYHDLFPEIRIWHRDLCLRVDGTKRRRGEEGERVDPWTLGVCYAENPFGYRHEFYNVVDWERTLTEENETIWHWSFGEDAKRLVSFLPQSTAAAIIKKTGKRIWNEHPDVGRSMRLWIHDSILGEVRDAEVERALSVSREVMEAPVDELPLDPNWGLGTHLSIGTEAKVGKSWADMKGVRE